MSIVTLGVATAAFLAYAFCMIGGVLSDPDESPRSKYYDDQKPEVNPDWDKMVRAYPKFLGHTDDESQ